MGFWILDFGTPPNPPLARGGEGGVGTGGRTGDRKAQCPFGPVFRGGSAASGLPAARHTRTRSSVRIAMLLGRPARFPRRRWYRPRIVIKTGFLIPSQPHSKAMEGKKTGFWMVSTIYSFCSDMYRQVAGKTLSKVVQEIRPR